MSPVLPSNESQSSWELGNKLAFLARYSKRTDEEMEPLDSRTCRHTSPASWAVGETGIISIKSLRDILVLHWLLHWHFVMYVNDASVYLGSSSATPRAGSTTLGRQSDQRHMSIDLTVHSMAP